MQALKISISILYLFFLLATAIAQSSASGSTAAAENGDDEHEAARLWQAIERGNTETAFWSLVDLYRRGGADIADAGEGKLKLKLQDYREIVNRYDNGDAGIELSRMTVSEAEAADYWENWSRVLAKGNFDHKKFFADDRERFLMANYNALVLAAHEIGHYLDYRYKISDRYIHGGILSDFTPLNCSEGYADRFAVGVVNHLAALDARFRRMRPRYLELIKTFNGVIPAENRYNFVSDDFANADKCATVDLLKNGTEDGELNENFFRQYASAYFNRHRLMLENPNYPRSLGEVIRRELLEPFFVRINYSDRKVTVRTLGEYGGTIRSDFFYGGEQFRRLVESDFGPVIGTPEKTNVPRKIRSTILNDEGQVRHVEIAWTARKMANEADELIFRENDFSLRLLGADEKIKGSFQIRVPANLRNNFVFSKVVLPTDDEIIAVLVPFDRERRFAHVVVLHLLKTGGAGWGAPRLLKFSTPGLTDADEIAESWFTTPAGRLNLLRKRAVKNSDAVSLAVYEIDRADFTAKLKRPPFVVRMKAVPRDESMKKGLWRTFDWGYGAFGNEAGAIFLAGGEYNLQFPNRDSYLFEIAAPEARAVLGNLDGIRDGDDPRRIQISSTIAPRFVGENRIVFLDGFGGKTYLRELVLR